jgi:hypothetical protein
VPFEGTRKKEGTMQTRRALTNEPREALISRLFRTKWGDFIRQSERSIEHLRSCRESNGFGQWPDKIGLLHATFRMQKAC